MSAMAFILARDWIGKLGLAKIQERKQGILPPPPQLCIAVEGNKIIWHTRMRSLEVAAFIVSVPAAIQTQQMSYEIKHTGHEWMFEMSLPSSSRRFSRPLSCILKEEDSQKDVVW